jgi:hypothetical protein
MEIVNPTQLAKAKDLIRKEILRALADNYEQSFKYDVHSNRWEIRYGAQLYGMKHGIHMLMDYPDYRVFHDYTDALVHRLLEALNNEDVNDE